MKENCNDKNSISAEESISKIKTYSMFDLIKYILICTVGSGLLYGPKVMVAESKKNTFIINLALGFVSALCMMISQCYAELKRMIPDEGGDFLYIQIFFSSIAGTIYSILTLFIIVPCCISFFLNSLFQCHNPFNINNITSETLQIKAIRVLSIATIVPLGLFSSRSRIVISSILSKVQQVGILILLITLPLACYLTHDLFKKSTIPNTNLFSLHDFLKTVSTVYFSFNGFVEGNSLPSYQIGSLRKPYLLGTFILYVIYATITNMFLYIFRNNLSELDYFKALEFIKNKSLQIIIYKFVYTILFICPLFSSSFLVSNNINYLVKQYKLNDVIYYSSFILIGIFSYIASYINIRLIFDCLMIMLLFSGCLSISGLLFYNKHGLNYKCRIPYTIIVGGLCSAILLFSLNGYYFIQSLIK